MILGFKEYFDNKVSQPTYFREKILLPYKPRLIAYGDAGSWFPKLHTIRAGSRWKAGDVMHMATGVRTKNYQQFNKGIPELERVKSVQKIEIMYVGKHPTKVLVDGYILKSGELLSLANNDGFDLLEHFFRWFSKDFTGQIIHFTDLLLMTFDQAKYIAQGVVAKLKPVCEEIKVCGGLRRLKAEVHDIDLVCLPKRDDVKDMFGFHTGYRVIPEFITVINSWEKIKGEPTGKYTQRLVEEEKVEISIASPDNMGCLVIIRTGPAEFSHMIMKRVLKCGLEQRDGHLYDGDKLIPVRHEIDYFRILDLPYVEPKDRHEDVYRKMRGV